MASPVEQKIHELRGKSTTSAGRMVFANATATHLHGFSDKFTFMIDEFHVVTWVELKAGNASPAVGDGDGEYRGEAFRGQLFHGKNGLLPADTTIKGGDATSGTANGGYVQVVGGAGNGNGDSGSVDVYALAGAGTGAGGGASIGGGESAGSAAGGAFVYGGASHGAGAGGLGQVTGGGNDSTGPAGGVNILAGVAAHGAAGTVVITGGQAQGAGAGGAVFIEAGDNTAGGTGGAFDFGAGNSNGVPGRSYFRGGNNLAGTSTGGAIWLHPAINDPLGRNGDIDLLAGENPAGTSTTLGNVKPSGAIVYPSYAFANLPTAAATAGAVIRITDSTTAVWGAVIAGGGGNSVMANHDGVNWRVMGK